MRSILTCAAMLTSVSAWAASPDEIFQANARSVVYLELRNGEGQTLETGSGFIVSHDGFVVTVAHIEVDDLNGEELWAVIGQREGTAYPLSRRETDENTDVAIWQLPQSPICRPATTISDGPPAVMDIIVAMGFPKTSGLTPNVLAINNLQTSRGFFKTDGFLEGGNSGGPVFNENGHVTGIVHGGGQPGTENNEIIPIGFARSLLEKWNVSFGLGVQAAYPDSCFASCRISDHGIESWAQETPWSGDSGWLGGGHSKDDECNKLASAKLVQLQGQQVEVTAKWEENKKDWGRAEYKYFCSGVVRSGAVYAERTSPACGILN